MFPSALLPQLQKYRSKQYDFQSIEANVLEVIKSRKLQHVPKYIGTISFVFHFLEQIQSVD